MLAYFSYLLWGPPVDNTVPEIESPDEATNRLTVETNDIEITLETKGVKQHDRLSDVHTRVVLPTTALLHKIRSNLKPIPERTIRTAPLSRHPVLSELLSSTPRVN
jgi:hypothetical protein